MTLRSMRADAQERSNFDRGQCEAQTKLVIKTAVRSFFVGEFDASAQQTAFGTFSTHELPV